MAAAGSTGKGTGGVKVSEVDSDRLWRDRVSQELSNQSKWVEEYGFMLDETTRQRLQAGRVAHGSTTDSSADSSTKKTRFPQTPTVGKLMSIHQSSYKVLPSPEIKGDPSPYRRRKHVFT